MIRCNSAIVVSAPSGAGKSTIISKVMEKRSDLDFAVSTTTRLMRNGETEGVEYYFRTKEQFQQMTENNEFAEWANVHSNYYGTSKKEIDRIIDEGRIPILDVDVQGAENLKEYLSDALYVFIVPPSLDILRTRLSKRNTDTEEQIAIRMNNAIIELEKYDLYDYIIINDDLNSAVENFHCILNAHTLRCSNMKEYVKNLLEESK